MMKTEKDYAKQVQAEIIGLSKEERKQLLKDTRKAYKANYNSYSMAMYLGALEQALAK